MATLRPHPVITSASLTGLVQGAVYVLGFLGYADQATDLDAKTQALVSVGLGGFALLTTILHGVHAESKVTPVASPLTSDGVPLVPATAAVPASMPALVSPAETLPALVTPTP